MEHEDVINIMKERVDGEYYTNSKGNIDNKRVLDDYYSFLNLNVNK